MMCKTLTDSSGNSAELIPWDVPTKKLHNVFENSYLILSAGSTF